MVSQSYMIEQSPMPSRTKLMVDREIIPVAVNAFGTVEVGLARAAELIRERPLSSVGAAFVLAFIGGRTIRRA